MDNTKEVSHWLANHRRTVTGPPSPRPRRLADVSGIMPGPLAAGPEQPGVDPLLSSTGHPPDGGSDLRVQFCALPYGVTRDDGCADGDLDDTGAREEDMCRGDDVAPRSLGGKYSRPGPVHPMYADVHHSTWHPSLALTQV